MRKASLAVCVAFVVSVGLVAACSSDTTTPALGGKDAGSSSGSSGAEVDARNAYPSFKDDVVPIILASCALAACHASADSPKGILLRERAQIYAELKKTSTTAVGEKFVIPGDPTNSYLMVKLEGRQNTLDAKCANAEPLKNCGTIMPQADIESFTPAKLATFRDWIKDGAKDN